MHDPSRHCKGSSRENTITKYNSHGPPLPRGFPKRWFYKYKYKYKEKCKNKYDDKDTQSLPFPSTLDQYKGKLKYIYKDTDKYKDKIVS